MTTNTIDAGENTREVYIQGETGLWEVIIGMEIHAQVKSKSKLFSGAATEFGAEPNSQVSLVDAAFPGMLPVINEFCVEQAIKTGLGIHAQINQFSVFDRKNYFYADLPQGYQISQFKHPIVGEGYLDIHLKDGSSKRIGIERIHLEQDAGKSIHDQHPTKTYIDLNRSGVALMEIVTKPYMRSAEEAVALFKALRTLLRCIDTCDGNMDQGSMRADVNVSLRRPGGPLGTRTETKNLNSFRHIQQAIDFEVARQMEILESGGEISQDTLLFDISTGQTRTMRTKEEANDYRYFPDPDLPPLRIPDAMLERVKKEMPELPDEKYQRFMNDYGLSSYDAAILTSENRYAKFYDDGIKNLKDSSDKKATKLLANWTIVELFGLLNKDGIELEDCKISAENLAKLINLISDNTISGKIAKQVFAIMWESGDSPDKIVEEKGLKQVTDTSEIEKIIDEVLTNNQNFVEEYKAGKDKLFGFFVGQVMKATQGKANPAMVNDLLKQKLS